MPVHSSALADEPTQALSLVSSLAAESDQGRARRKMQRTSQLITPAAMFYLKLLMQFDSLFLSSSLLLFSGALFSLPLCTQRDSHFAGSADWLTD